MKDIMPNIGDYIIYSRFGYISDFLVGKVIRIKEESKYGYIDGIYHVEIIFLYGIETDSSERQFSKKANVEHTNKDDWQKVIINKIFNKDK